MKSDRETKEKLLESGKLEFLEKGYMKHLCEKSVLMQALQREHCTSFSRVRKICLRQSWNLL